MNEDRVRTRLVVLALLGLALFNYPLLRIFDRDVIVAGLPLVWLYLFVAWALLITLVAVTTRDR